MDDFVDFEDWPEHLYVGEPLSLKGRLLFELRWRLRDWWFDLLVKLHIRDEFPF